MIGAAPHQLPGPALKFGCPCDGCSTRSGFLDNGFNAGKRNDNLSWFISDGREYPTFVPACYGSDLPAQGWEHALA